MFAVRSYLPLATGLIRSSLAECLVEKWGYESVKAMKKDALKRFSLLEGGVLDQPSTKLLLINVSTLADL